VAHTLASELEAQPARERADLLAALDLALSWEAWDALRRVQVLSVTAATRVTTLLVMRLLPTQSVGRRRTGDR
jgi:hypothetical protein